MCKVHDRKDLAQYPVFWLLGLGELTGVLRGSCLSSPPQKKTELLHCEGDRSGLHNAPGGARHGDDVRSWSGTGIPSAAASTSNPAAGKYASSDGEKQNEHSEDAPPSPPPCRESDQQDARDSHASNRRPEEFFGSVERGGGRRGANDKGDRLRPRAVDGNGSWDEAHSRLTRGRCDGAA